MRTHEQIGLFCDRLKDVWETVPYWRFGQLIENLFDIIKSSKLDPFYLEDDKMIQHMEHCFEQEE